MLLNEGDKNYLVGLLGSYQETLNDEIDYIESVYEVASKNCAGFDSMKDLGDRKVELLEERSKAVAIKRKLCSI